MKKMFFIDFDGTITEVDTCVAVLNAFAKDGWKDINDMWERKELTTEECAERALQLINVGPGELKSFLKTIKIDDYFLDFLAFCQQRGEQVYVLSDGYDLHIDTIFCKYGIKLPYYANQLRYDSGFQIISHYKNYTCGDCGTCKTTLMKRLNKEGYQCIYIGDGCSDTCPAEHADMVFAKDMLYEHCMKHGVAATHFNNFREIILYLTNEGGCRR
jgi:2-hydroxy-3-keto-5-methylthiopentenyl-1-phosphate phosphatase